jgi:hypothetical protein
MKNTNLTIKLLTTGILLFLSICQLSAQENNFSDRLSVRLGAAFVNAEPLKYNNELVTVNLKPQFGVTVNYEWFKNFDAGVYFAYSNLGHMVDTSFTIVDNKIIGYGYGSVPSHSFYYGIDVNYHFLPLIFGTKNLRFDLYQVSTVGFVSRKWSELDGTEVKISPSLEYHFGLGLGYKFSKHIELQAEYSLGRLYNEGKSKASLGLLFNF